MHRRIKEFWDKHEGWAAPLAMVFFLVAGLQIGVKIGDTRTQELNAETINSMQERLEAKDQIIAEKDARLRELQDRQMENQEVTGQALGEATKAATVAAKAAVEAATAATMSAESAKTAASKDAK